MDIYGYFALPFYFFVSLIILVIGSIGIFVFRRNLITILISLEIMLLSVHMNFLVSSIFLDDISGYIFSIFILVVAGSEVSIGLALTILLYRLQKDIRIEPLTLLKG